MNSPNLFVSRILLRIEKFKLSWLCPAGIAHKKWAKELYKRVKRLSTESRLFLLRYSLGAENFNLENRKYFRSIANNHYDPNFLMNYDARQIEKLIEKNEL